jgi:hypothetical protein
MAAVKPEGRNGNPSPTTIFLRSLTKVTDLFHLWKELVFSSDLNQTKQEHFTKVEVEEICKRKKKPRRLFATRTKEGSSEVYANNVSELPEHLSLSIIYNCNSVPTCRRENIT